MIIALSLMCCALLAILIIQQSRDSKFASELLKRMDDLQADNKALTEALVRSEGKSLIFRKSEVVDGEGWFDKMTPAGEENVIS